MAKKIAYYRKKADKLMQMWGRLNYTKCLICGKKMSCLHHYYPKSSSSTLRYDEDNLIPICQGCHFRHHNGDPSIHNTVNEKKGKAWLKRLQSKKEGYIKTNIQYYKDIIEKYEEANRKTERGLCSDN